MKKIFWRLVAASGVQVLRLWVRVRGSKMKEETRLEIQGIIDQYQTKVSK